MRNILFLMALMSIVVLQGCHTTKSHICTVCHPEEAMQAEAEMSPEKNPFKQMNTWVEEHMW